MSLGNIRQRFQQMNQQRQVNFEQAFWGDVGNFIQSDIGSYNPDTKSIVFPTQLLPNKTLLWNEYNKLATERGVKADYAQFIAQYDGFKKLEDNKYLQVINSASTMGMKAKDIKKAIQANPIANQRINNIYMTSDANTQASMVDMLKPEKSWGDWAMDLNPWQAMAGAGGLGLAAYGLGKGAVKGGLATKDYFFPPEEPKKESEKIKEEAKGKGKGGKGKGKVPMVKTKVPSQNVSTKDMGIKGAPEYFDRDKLTKFTQKQYQMDKMFWEEDNPGKKYKKFSEWRKGKTVPQILKGASSDEIKSLAGKKFKMVTKEVPDVKRKVYGPPTKEGVYPKAVEKPKTAKEKFMEMGKKGWKGFKGGKGKPGIIRRNPLTTGLLALQAAQLLGSDEE